ncbi:MAG TPA: sugar phosphate isomerase/epimerase family protein [Pirellulaceae bacterium]|nr:sugar phosphate isomerase/epimerase family protein [Pirellulaceae bacterium]HMO91777.1 sugar phosphate isomerase/epimerase family protein [Pirellulaceae bacterium]HMP69576.1 sugar phosphate isomerase/epimerase family protein [Pirellulaceae bacterium]
MTSSQQFRLLQDDQLDIDFAFGFVTYLWGKDWDLTTLLKNCQDSGLLGIELRTTHAHGVEPALSTEERELVRHQFAESGVTLVGLGSDERFDSPDEDKLKLAIKTTCDFVVLSHDVGGSGVKVKPDSFHPNVPRETTIRQIGESLNKVAEFAEGYGQQIRLEVHGSCAHLPTIKQIMDIADHPNVAVCWNCNPEDLAGEGLEHNFKLVEDRLAHTLHVRELDLTEYPYDELFALLRNSTFCGWVLLEARTNPKDRVEAMKEQLALFRRLNTQ